MQAGNPDFRLAYGSQRMSIITVPPGLLLIFWFRKGVFDMLVLTRKTTETIRIGNDITITILRVKGQTVRVGIEAPRDVRVIRGELPTKEGRSNEMETNKPSEHQPADRDDLEIPATDILMVRESSPNESSQVIEFRFSPTHSPGSGAVSTPQAANLARTNAKTPVENHTAPLAGRGPRNRLPLATLDVEGVIVKR